MTVIDLPDPVVPVEVPRCRTLPAEGAILEETRVRRGRNQELARPGRVSVIVGAAVHRTLRARSAVDGRIPS